MTCRHELSVAAYALGTLDAADRAEIAAHLPGCPTCRSRLEELAGLPGLLARVPAHVAADGLPRPDERLLDRALASLAAEAARRGRRRRFAAAAAAVVLVVAGAGTAVLARQDASPGSTTVAGEQGGVQARVDLTPAEEGTALALELSGVAPAQVCRLVAVAEDGTRDLVATWQVSYTGRVEITGRTAMSAGRIGRLVVETDGRTLLELPVER